MNKPQSRRAALTFDGVERDLTSGAPSAFRIWRAGDNTTAHGPTVFTEKSAALLLEQQTTKGTKYSIDVNHLSLDASAPLQNQRAVGWFSIDVRDGELWATDCEWVDWVKSGLTSDPPEWKYHSPAYDVDVETGEVVSLTNLAITNTPATFYVTALASETANSDTSRKKASMTKEDFLAALASADEDTQSAIHSAIGAAAVEKARAKSKASAGEEPADESDDSVKASEKDDGEDDGKNPKEPKDLKGSVMASLVAKQDKELAALKKIVASLQKKNESDERSELLSKHEMTKELRASLASLPLESVKAVCAGLPKANPLANRGSEHIQATSPGSASASGVPTRRSEHADYLDQKMGLKKDQTAPKHEGRKSTFRMMTSEDAKAHLASISKKGGN